MVVVWAVAVATAARAQAPEVELSAVPEYAAVRPGAAFRVAVRLRLPPGWHIYWINPGAGGLPTTIAWHLPAGVTGGDTDWPYPETDDAGGDVSNVYRGTVVLFSSFAAGPDIAGRVALSADLVWGMCKVQCVRQERTVGVSLPVSRAAKAPTLAWDQVVLALRALSVSVHADRLHAAVSGDSVRLVISGLPAGPMAGSWLTFFPLEPGKASVVAEARAAHGGVAIVLPRTVVSGEPAGRLSGVLVAAHAPGAQPPVRPLAVDVAVGE
ncbi:MAG: hypothetical protein B7Z72_12795 [Gemmatimonadetes bacterium 21-71-4]|nr:MAG: hypothetical protein B7Z72_12795 [Gemmatimonadetes bacterium 21-71-4]